jgi:6-pyruvoyltetrahydropterin/6-carboxytetrahydropterin synthase
MYKIERRFTVPIGHRLSKHDGLCKNIHGHNFTVHVGVKAEKLDDNDMVMDFSFLKDIVKEQMDQLDHCLVLNESDGALARDLRMHGICDKVMTVPHDPTAERLAEKIYHFVSEILEKDFSWVSMDYVTVYENENSKATFTM